MIDRVDLYVQRRAAIIGRACDLLEASSGPRPEPGRNPPSQVLGFADLLLEKALAAQPHDLLSCEELAWLAFATAEPVVADRWVGRANDVKARACVVVGDVRRLMGSREEAEEMFRKAVFHLTGPPDGLERAFYCRHLALLRQDQGRFDEATGLLWRAAMIYRESGELRDQGRCMAQLGFLFLEEEEIERATPPLTRACQTLERPDAVLYLRCALALAYCHASLGETERSERLVATARPLRSHVPDAGQGAHVTWFEGKLAALGGSREEAAGLLDTARGVFLGLGGLDAAARVSIDLGLVWAEMGQGERIQELTDDLARALQKDHAKVGLLFALAPIAEAARRRTDLREALASALSRLRCCRRDPVRALGYGPAFH